MTQLSMVFLIIILSGTAIFVSLLIAMYAIHTVKISRETDRVDRIIEARERAERSVNHDKTN